MFQMGDLVVYGSSGVCRVDEVGPMEGAKGGERERVYYRLSLVHGGGIIYAPVDGAVFMRPVISAEEAQALIDRIPGIEEEACSEFNPRLLTEHYHAVLETHRCEDLIGLIKTLYVKNKNAAQRGKRLGMVDQRYKKQAEDLVYGELAVALNIPYEAVEDYITRRVEQSGARVVG